MNILEKFFASKKTENNDDAFSVVSNNNLLNIFFMSAYFEKHLDEVKLGNTDKEKLFAMFVRDPRFGLGRRDLGRELMKQSELKPADIVKAGRYDDLIYIPTDENINYFMDEVKNGNNLAKKWAPRLTSGEKGAKIAKKIIKMCNLTEKEYRKLIKVVTTESMLSEKRIDEIEFEKVPSLAMLKYYNRFMAEDRFKKYIESVKNGESKLNISTTNVYDIYRKRNEIDAQLFFDKIDKIDINCIPILDTSGSMCDNVDSIGKATSIAHYLSKCSSFCRDYVVTFSANPHLIHMGESRKAYETKEEFLIQEFKRINKDSDYINEINSLFTGEYTNTDFGKVMELFKGMNSLPEYLVVLSDMEFDYGSSMSKDDTMKLFKSKGYTTKIIWWNFNARGKTTPETDDYGNIFISGYNPFLLKFLECGFDANAFLEKLLNEYKLKIEK